MVLSNNQFTADKLFKFLTLYKLLCADKKYKRAVRRTQHRINFVYSNIAVLRRLFYCQCYFHYIEDFKKLFADVYSLLNPNGAFVFSMEHPMYTASKFSQQWITDPNSSIATGFVTDHYGDEGVRNITWLGKNITKYHHKVDSVFNALIEAGFLFEKVIEPTPSEELIQKVPKTAHELHRPAYLILKCRKG